MTIDSLRVREMISSTVAMVTIFSMESLGMTISMVDSATTNYLVVRATICCTGKMVMTCSMLEQVMTM